MLNLGVRAHDFGKLPADELAARIAAHGLTCVQLAPPKAIAGFENESLLSSEFARTVAQAFHRHGISIAVLGCYINLGDRNEATRRPQLERFKEHLRFAADFGCRIVATETGSLNADFSRHPANGGEEAFQIVLASVQELAREAERYGAIIGIEAVERYVISTSERLRRLVDSVNSPNVRVIYDPVNLLWSTNHTRQTEILATAHALLGDRIRVVHAKDFVVEGPQFQERSAGEGQLDYPAVIRWLKAQPKSIPVILENTHPETIARTVAFVRDAYQRA
jgi:sugar phosphate isomerase/epimerase